MKNTIKYTCFAFIILLSFGACKKGFLDVNSNPNTAVESTPALVLPNALNLTAYRVSVTLNQLGAIWGGHWAPATDFLWYVNEKQYNISSSFYASTGFDATTGALVAAGIWDPIYDNLNDYQYIETKSTGIDPNYEAIAKIMKALNYQFLVDNYNNIPFTEALKGTTNLRPKYDEGQFVYEECIKLLDAGINLIKTAPVTAKKPSGDDIFFGGDMTEWIKFANTIKLRMLLRQSEMPGRYTAYLKAEFDKIVAEGTGFIGVGESVMSDPGYIGGTRGKQSPFWDAYYKDAAGAEKSDYRATRPTEYVLGKYNAFNDPRKARIYQTVDGIYKGVALGINTGDANAANFKASVTSPFLPPTADGPGGILKSASQPAVILSSSESLFLQAEAAQRGWIPGNAQAFYEDAIKESFAYIGVEDAAEVAETYYKQPIANVGFAASPDKLTAIITQKWLALNSINSWESWNDFRRLTLPADMPLSLAASIKKFPSRLVYPNSEVGTNGDEIAKQGEINPFDSKIFWDVK